MLGNLNRLARDWRTKVDASAILLRGGRLMQIQISLRGFDPGGGGRIQHALSVDDAFKDVFHIPSAAYVDTPTLSSSVGFNGGLGIGLDGGGVNNALVFDQLLDQSGLLPIHIFNQVYCNSASATSCQYLPGVGTRNINGVTKARHEVGFYQFTAGGAVAIGVALIPVGTSMAFQFLALMR